MSPGSVFVQCKFKCMLSTQRLSLLLQPQRWPLEVAVCVVRPWFWIEQWTNKKKSHQHTVWIAVIFQFFCHLSRFCSGTIAKSQVHLPVFAPHPGEGDKPPGSKPAVFCVTVSSCCALHLTATRARPSAGERRGWKDRAGHLCARGAQGY